MNLNLVESTTWNGEPEFTLSFEARESKLLYLVKFRAENNTPIESHDALTPAETASGARTFQVGEKIYRHVAGHDTGRLHSTSAAAVLTWTLEPGDEVLHVFEVRFSGKQALIWQPDFSETEPYNQATEWIAAKCDPVINSVLVSLDSTPGRGAMLGEDALDEAFGNDNLRGQLEAALEGDWRKCLCEVRYTPAPEGDYKEVVRPWREAQVIAVAARPAEAN